eukprot:g4905.t1
MNLFETIVLAKYLPLLERKSSSDTLISTTAAERVDQLINFLDSKQLIALANSDLKTRFTKRIVSLSQRESVESHWVATRLLVSLVKLFDQKGFQSNFGKIFAALNLLAKPSENVHTQVLALEGITLAISRQKELTLEQQRDLNNQAQMLISFIFEVIRRSSGNKGDVRSIVDSNQVICSGLYVLSSLFQQKVGNIKKMAKKIEAMCSKYLDDSDSTVRTAAIQCISSLPLNCTLWQDLVGRILYSLANALSGASTRAFGRALSGKGAKLIGLLDSDNTVLSTQRRVDALATCLGELLCNCCLTFGKHQVVVPTKNIVSIITEVLDFGPAEMRMLSLQKKSSDTNEMTISQLREAVPSFQKSILMLLKRILVEGENGLLRPYIVDICDSVVRGAAQIAESSLSLFPEWADTARALCSTTGAGVRESMFQLVPLLVSIIPLAPSLVTDDPSAPTSIEVVVPKKQNGQKKQSNVVVEREMNAVRKQLQNVTVESAFAIGAASIGLLGDIVMCCSTFMEITMKVQTAIAIISAAERVFANELSNQGGIHSTLENNVLDALLNLVSSPFAYGIELSRAVRIFETVAFHGGKNISLRRKARVGLALIAALMHPKRKAKFENAREMSAFGKAIASAAEECTAFSIARSKSYESMNLKREREEEGRERMERKRLKTKDEEVQTSFPLEMEKTVCDATAEIEAKEVEKEIVAKEEKIVATSVEEEKVSAHIERVEEKEKEEVKITLPKISKGDDKVKQMEESSAISKENEGVNRKTSIEKEETALEMSDSDVELPDIIL